jgi:glucosamine--fructose-6-phosphate aminotransferase (isomerizing)
MSVQAASTVRAAWANVRSRVAFERRKTAMCGIFGYAGERRDAAELILTGLKGLEYRGYDSWGVVVTNGARAVVDKRVGKIGGATTALPASSLGLGHTRWATHGGVTEENAHPHLDCDGCLAVVHNGIVDNDVELRRALERRGHRFSSETDTELIAHLVEEALNDASAAPHRDARSSNDAPRAPQTETPSSNDVLVLATMSAFRRLRGLNAIVVLDVVTGALAAAKNGSPLVLGFGEREHFLSSDQSAIAPHTRRVSFVKEGQAVSIVAGTARLFDVESGREVRAEVTTAQWEAASADKGDHPDFMTKEIREQPSALRRISRSSGESVRALAELVRASRDVFAIGCGSGFHAALATEYFFGAAGVRVTAVPGSEFSHRLRFVTQGSLVIALSQSGETIDILEAVRGARDNGATVAALTNVEGSSLARFADVVVPLGVGPERCVLSTKSLVAKLALSFLTARALAGDLATATRMVERAAADIEGMLDGDRRRAVYKTALTINDSRHLFVLGRGPSFALALETALKVKEVSYMHAEGFAAGELKHGVIALIEPKTPCIVLAPNDDTRSDVMAAAMQVKARGATVIGIAPEPHDAFDHFIEVADLGDATAIVNAVPAQLLGYDLARLRGNDPDMPRNLAKSVTVK